MKFGLRHIRYFTAVAEELHFRRAAVRLGIAQPALSRAIRYLEHELAVTLFERSNRSVVLTPAGKTFLEGCRSVINTVERTVDDTRQVHRGQIGTLRIGYTDFAIAGALPNLMKEFQRMQPGIVLQPHHDVTADQLRKLEEGNLDIGFVTGPITRPGYDQCLIQRDRLICVVYEHHPLAERSSVRLDELANEDFVHGPTRDWEHFYAYLMPLCHRCGFVPRIVQEAFNSAGILGLVASGMGVTILTESTHSLAVKGLVAIPLEDVPERLTTVALWNSNNARGSIGMFVDFMRAQNLPGD